MNPWLRVPLDLIFPSSCLLCKKPISGKEIRGPGLVFLCLSCQRNAQPDPHFDFPAKSHLEFVWSVATFQGSFREMIHAFKYQGKEWLAPHLAQLVMSRLQLDWSKIDALVPIPAPFWKEIRRGYNQSESLAVELGKHQAIPVIKNLLSRTWWARPQVGLSKRDRRQNVEKGYQLRRKTLPHQLTSILLIDDVVTTGATLNHCAMLLRKLGVKKVAAVVVARDEL